MRDDTASIRRSRFTVAIGAAAVAAILLAGCSGPGSTLHASRESDPRPAPTTPSTAPGSGQEPDPSPEDRGDEGRPGEERRGERRRDERGGKRRAETAAFCEMLRTPEDQAPESPDELLAWMDELVSVAPPQIRDDVEVWRDVAGTLTSLDEGDPENLARMFEALTDPRIRQAAEKIGRFAERECGLELEDAFGDLDPFPGD